jgi:UrcA family protein
MRRSILAVLSAGALLAFPAAAESRDGLRDQETVRISLAPYDLHSEASVGELYRNIIETAASVCAEINDTEEDRDWCAEHAVERAIDRADIEPLSRYHEAHLTAGEPATLALR